MLVFDELKKNDPQLRLVAVGLAAGLFILLAGLWWVQIANAGQYRSDLQTQSYRTVRVPAMRGRILDCEGRVLAENTARYNLSLYLGDLTPEFKAEYEILHPTKPAAKVSSGWKFWERSSGPKAAPLTKDEINMLTWESRDQVAYGIFNRMSQTLGRPLTFDVRNFQRAYNSSLYEPYPILQNLSPAEMARFEETYTPNNGVDLDVQSMRIYPYGKIASLVLGYVQEDDSSIEGEDSFFNYRLPDYRGVVGIEGGFDSELHGRAGEESVLVNNQGFRQTENTGTEPEPGQNVVLTLDLDIEKAAEQSIAQHQGANACAAAVVMDVRTGDIVAMVSSPTIDPNYFTGNLPPDEIQKTAAMLEDPKLRPQINRATYENYAPGSIFKPVVGLAALDNGLNPHEIYQVQANPEDPAHGCIYIGPRKIKDTVAPGDYDFNRAMAFSSNSYFIHCGTAPGVFEKVVALAERFHFGEKTGLPTKQETRGIFPSLEQINQPGWHIGDSANICFGQGQMAVTPIQIAVAYSAIANGGTILWPRLVARVEPQDTSTGEEPTAFPAGVVRDEIGVRPRSLRIVHDAMLDETENGTGKPADVPGLQICGKTGTAQVENEHGEIVSHNYWFASFAPYENPKYAVVVMVQSQSGGSGGSTCAPIAHDIYTELVKKGNLTASPTVASAN
jgi:penicillin-binding protein 2